MLLFAVDIIIIFMIILIIFIFITIAMLIRDTTIDRILFQRKNAQMFRANENLVFIVGRRNDDRIALFGVLNQCC